MYRHIEKEEKKLTDEEIVKALECCTVDEVTDCENCPLLRESCAIIRKYALDLIHRLQAENRRLTDTLNQYINGELINAETMGEIISLEKQVDELKELNAKYLDSIESVQAGRCRLRCVLTEQAVKDTAKEILQMLYDDRNGYWDSCDCGKDETYWRDNSIQGTLNEIKERYGVEVE